MAFFVLRMGVVDTPKSHPVIVKGALGRDIPTPILLAGVGEKKLG